MDSEPVLREEDFPTVYRAADSSSMLAQRRFLTAVGTALALTGLAAVMGVVSASWAGWVGAASFLSAIAIGALAVTRNLERTWYDGRALAESVKSLTWLYVVRGGDLADTESPEESFRARLRALSEELRRIDYVLLPTSGSEISDRMRALRAASLGKRRETYLRDRVEDQAAYYRRRGAQHRSYAQRFRVAIWIAQSVGLVGAVLKATSVIDIDLLGIGAAAAAAFTAWLQTRDHVTLERAYRLTAEDLDAVKEDLPPDGSETEWSAYVANAEASMSREHVMWLARRGRVGEA